jgi:hypothetical protein
VYGLQGSDGPDGKNPTAAPATDPAKPPPDPPPTEKKRSRNILLVSQQEGVVLLVGTEVKSGEKVPAELLIPAQGAGKRTFKAIREGDQVKIIGQAR